MPKKSPIADMADAIDSAPEAPDLREPEGIGAGDDLDIIDLPPDCPVVALGHQKGRNYFLDFAGQLIELGSEFRKGEIMMLFGPKMYWLERQDNMVAWKNFGGNTKENPPDVRRNGFDQTKVQKSLILACTSKRLFDPVGKVRGRGSHCGAHGEVILHAGDAVLVGGRKGVRGEARETRWAKPGEIGAFIFPTASGLPHPPDKGAPIASGRGLVSLVASWNWKSGVTVDLYGTGKADVPIEALLTLGWINCAKLCGAISKRPHMWLVGPSGAGKTTLQKTISALLADWALESDDPSAAYIMQSLVDQRLPVLYDEPEPSEDVNSFVKQIVQLARLATTGGKKGRGSSDHKAVDSQIFSCFLFSSILHHELEPQDRNRMAIMALSKFPNGTAAMDVPAIEANVKRWGLSGTLAEIGLALTRRLIDQWPRYRATLGAYQAELLRRGVDPRGQDTYGELLAMADLALFDAAPIVELDMADPNPVTAVDEERRGRARRLVDALGPMLSIASAETEDTSERCLGRLTSTLLPAAGGKHQESVARWIERALVELYKETIETGAGQSRDAFYKLRGFGMKLVHARQGKDGLGAVEAFTVPGDNPVYLAVANADCVPMKGIFKGSTWAGGEWSQALTRIEGAQQSKVKIRYDGKPHWSVLIPVGEACDMNAAQAEANRQVRQARLDSAAGE